MIKTMVAPTEKDELDMNIPGLLGYIIADGNELHLINLTNKRVIQDNGELNAALDSERKARRKAEEEVARLEAELKKYRGES